MTDRRPFPPLRTLSAALVVNLLLIVLSCWYAVQQPWLGLKLVADGERVSVASSQGPAHAIPANARLLALEAADGRGRVELVPRDLLEEPDGIDTYPELAEFFARQDLLAGLLQRPEVRLHWQAEGGPASTLVRPLTRPLSDLPPVFWFQMFAGVIGCLIGCWVWALRPDDWGARMFALTGLMFPLFTTPAAIYSTRELALPDAGFQLLSGLNHTGALLFGCALVGIFLCYPRLLVAPRRLLWLPVVFGGFLAADQLRIAPDMDWGYRIPVMTEMALAIVLAGVQWHGTRGRPLERAALRWLTLSALVGCGLFVFTTAGHELFDLLPPLSQGYSFGFFLVMYAGIALGLRRYRLFQLDEWAYRILLWVGGALLVIALDALFVVLLGMNQALSLGTTLLLAGLAYFPMRQWLWLRHAGQRHVSRQRTMRDLISVALLTSPAEREAAWDALLEKRYSPLQMKRLESPPEVPTLARDGLALLLPACGDLAGRELTYPALGDRLFSARDVEFADDLCRLMAHAAAGRDAYERGAVAERQRIARDMHDDVGARLLMLIHRTRDNEIASIARAAMSDLRTAIATLDAQPIGLADALADWRAEMHARCETANVALDWREPEELPERQLSAWQRANLEKVLREALTNALKHASPQRVQVDVGLTDNRLTLAIANDGATPPELWTEGRGLRNMRSRLAELGGNIAFGGIDEHRVSLTVALPLSA